MNADKLAERIVKRSRRQKQYQRDVPLVTRLRFYLKDRSVVDEERIKKLDGVYWACSSPPISYRSSSATRWALSTMPSSTKLALSWTMPPPKKKKMRIGGIFETIFGHHPAGDPAMAGTGIPMGIITIMTSYLGFDSASALIKMMTIAADCVFYFLPFFIAWSAAKRFKTDTALALMCAGFMLYPTMTAGLAEGASR